LLALQRASPADLLEVRLERPSLPRDLEVVRRQRGRGAGRSPPGLLSRLDFELLVELHQFTSRALEIVSAGRASRWDAARGEKVAPSSINTAAAGGGRASTGDVAHLPAFGAASGEPPAWLSSLHRAPISSTFFGPPRRSPWGARLLR